MMLERRTRSPYLSEEKNGAGQRLFRKWQEESQLYCPRSVVEEDHGKLRWTFEKQSALT
jgi:hypothetical protein